MIEVTIPRLGWSMDEGTFARWLKAPGEFIKAGDLVFELEGDKASQEIESFDSGYLCVPSDAPQPGETVKVGDVIAFLLADGEPAPESVRADSLLSSSRQPPASPESASKPVKIVDTVIPRVAGPAARRKARELHIDLDDVATPDPTGRVLSDDVQRAAFGRPTQSVPAGKQRPVATPRARRRAGELGIDWTRLVGTGRDGRVREHDVLIETHAHSSNQSLGLPETEPTEPGHFVPASKLRRITAQRVSAAVHQAAPVTLTTKVNAEVLVAHRDRLKSSTSGGIVPSYNDILIHHVAQTLRELPELNACWVRGGIHVFDAIHIATAVDTPRGLLAPVVRDADQLTLQSLAEQTRQLIELARSGELNQNQLTGGTFTVSNLGMFDVDAFTPILNLPQAAILGVGRIVEEPVARGGQLVIGKRITLSLTFDHRVVDGAPAARWLQRLSQRVQAEA